MFLGGAFSELYRDFWVRKQLIYEWWWNVFSKMVVNLKFMSRADATITWWWFQIFFIFNPYLGS